MAEFDIRDGAPGIQPERAAAAVARLIEAMILEGSLRPGDALLAERDLAARLNVSRPTLRDGLKLLEEKGLLTPAGRGLQIAPLGMQAIGDPLLALLADHGELADDCLEFRDIVESEAAALAARRASDTDLAHIRDCLTRIDAAHDAGDPALEAEVDAALHLAIYEASHNLVLLHIMRALSASLRNDVVQNRNRLFTRPDTREALRAQHHRIGAAILARDPAAAQAAAHDHLDWLRHTTREIRDAEARRQVAERRRQGPDLTNGKGGAT